MADIYKSYKQRLLNSKENTFDITQTLFQQVNNDYWREKSNVWNIISAACNDAASEFYVKLREYVKNLADIDVCTIHNLKSIALSVDANHLLDFTKSLLTFPIELRELLDILSIKPSKLLEADQKLHYSSLLPLYGNIDIRSCLYRPEKLPITLLMDIFENIDKIEKWFKFNSILPDATIKYIFNKSKTDTFSDQFLTLAKLYNLNLEDESFILYYNLDLELDLDKQIKLEDILYLKVSDVINNIKYLKFIFEDEKIKKNTHLAQLLSFDLTQKDEDNIKQFIKNNFNINSIVILKNEKFLFNPFFALIEIVKARVFSSYNNLPLVPYYKELGDNEVTIDMSNLCLNIIQVIKRNDSCYIRNFMFFHIYNLIYSKIINDKLKDDFLFDVKVKNETIGTISKLANEIENWNEWSFIDINKITYNSKYSEFTYELFYPTISSWISNNELKEFLGLKIDQDTLNITRFKLIEVTNKIPVYHYKKEYEDFIQYLSLVKAITGKELESKKDILRQLPYLIYRYNNYLEDTNSFNQYKQNLLGENDGLNYIQKVAEYLTDICIKISYIRLEIKGLVQQYSFIGTLRIVTDVVRDYFVKNFSKRSSWRYISDKFKNKDNTPYLKTIEKLNGNEGEKQFTALIIEYFDQTSYLNIETDLPPVINGYRSVLTTFPSTYITTETSLSTWTLTSDVTSTIYNNLGFIIPSSLYPSPSMISTLTIPAVTVEGTVLYSLMVSSAINSENLITLNNETVISSEIINSLPVTTQTINYIQTLPTTTHINDSLEREVFYNYCINTLHIPQSSYEELLNNISEFVITTQILTSDYKFDKSGNLTATPTAVYYSVVANMKNSVTINTISTTKTVNNTNIPIGYSPSETDIVPVVKFPAPTSLLLQPEQKLTGEFYNPAASSFVIPKGTSVSSIVPAGTEITVMVTSTLQIPIWVDGNEIVKSANIRYWERNLDYLNWEDLSSEISFYEKYFPQLANAPTDKLKLSIYKEEVYPLLTEIWDVHATSGILDGLNDAIHLQYSGQYPGKQLERNIGNQDFTTIAPLPCISNLIEVNTYDNDDSYIVKPLYDNISYYMNMFMEQMFNMYKIQADNGLAIAIDGWKQTHIEFKGYSSKYERSANTIATLGLMNSKLDYDGPWVYSSLKAFLNLKENNKISIENIKKYVDEYFFNITTSKVKENIINKLFKYQQEIFDKGEKGWKLYSFESDLNDNQYTLFKMKNYFKYEDVGLIWVRMKNFPLSIPLMNRNVVIDFKDVKYQNDVYDTLLFNLNTKYANMLKQLTNNAVQFGVVKNVMWILGWTNYNLNSNQRLVFNEVLKTLKLISFKFKIREDFTLLVDPISVKSYYIKEEDNNTLIKQNDKLHNFNLFVGVNYKEKTNSIDFVLYNSENNSLYINNYSIDSEEVENYLIELDKNEFPALQIESITALIDTSISTDSVQLGQTYIIKNNINNINIGTVYLDINTNEVYISGYSGLKKLNNISIYSQTLNNINKFKYYITGDLNENKLSSINLIEIDDNEISSVISTSLIPLINFNYDIDEEPIFETLSTINSYANIWKLGADENNTGIAYLVYDFKNKELLSSYFNLKQDLLNQKIINNIFAISSELLTKQVIDSNNNIIYLNQIKTISTAIESASIYLNNDNKNDYIAIQQLFPFCHLTKNNHLVISSLATTLGGYKSLTVNKDEKNIYEVNGMNLLTTTINSSFTNNTFEDIITNNKSYFIRNNQKILLKDNLLSYKTLFNNNIIGTYDFYKYYDKYIDRKINNKPLSLQKKYLLLYNQQMAKLNDVVAFAPVVNEFIIEPLKIIFNFGDIFNFDINSVNPNKTNYFDLDTKTYIDTDELRYKKVGWKAGLWQTDYINWVTRDERFGGPEIVTVNIEKYKLDNINSYNMNLSDYSIDIIVNACWFSLSQIQSLNPNIFVNWKGFMYQYMIEDIETNHLSCDFPFLKIRVGLNNNTLRCYRKVLIPVGLFNKHTNENLFGFIRIWEDEINDKEFIISSYETKDWYISIDLLHILNNYLQFELICNNPEESKKLLKNVGIYDTKQMYDLLENELFNNKIKQLKTLSESLNWNKTMILNILDLNNILRLLEVHIKKIII